MHTLHSPPTHSHIVLCFLLATTCKWSWPLPLKFCAIQYIQYITTSYLLSGFIYNLDCLNICKHKYDLGINVLQLEECMNKGHCWPPDLLVWYNKITMKACLIYWRYLLTFYFVQMNKQSSFIGVLISEPL